MLKIISNFRPENDPYYNFLREKLIHTLLNQNRSIQNQQEIINENLIINNYGEIPFRDNLFE